MALNLSEIASLLAADHGTETFITEADGTITGAFVPGAAKRDDGPRGDDAVMVGILTITAGSATLDEQQLLTRAADSTVWEVDLVNPAAYGMQDIDLRYVRAISRGNF